MKEENPESKMSSRGQCTFCGIKPDSSINTDPISFDCLISGRRSSTKKITSQTSTVCIPGQQQMNDSQQWTLTFSHPRLHSPPFADWHRFPWVCYWLIGTQKMRIISCRNPITGIKLWIKSSSSFFSSGCLLALALAFGERPEKLGII